MGSTYLLHYSDEKEIDGYLDLTFSDYYSFSNNQSYLNVENTGAMIISRDDSNLNQLLWNHRGQYLDKRLRHITRRYKLDHTGKIVNKYNEKGSVVANYEYDDDGYLIRAYSINTDLDWEYLFEWSNGDLVFIDAQPRWLGIENGDKLHFNIYIKYSEKINNYDIDLTTTLVHDVMTDFFTNWSDRLDNWGYFGKMSKHLPVEIYDGSEDYTYHYDDYEESSIGLGFHVTRTPFIEDRPDNLDAHYYLLKDTPSNREIYLPLYLPQ